ncbi:aminopeptidase P family protein [Nocardioides sp. MH1]|uniref:aminopeptidase P family protein n=1 Tax=Nocardioides sp. MH1 TaxID=3242490 RepID=UPI003521E33B
MSETSVKARSMPRPEGDPRTPSLTGAHGFNEFIARDWGSPDRTPVVVDGAPAAAADHRARLGEQYAGQALVVAGGRAQVRANDCDHDFRADSSFMWLTGCGAEDAVLVMTPVQGGHDAVLYLPAPFYPGHPSFYDDAGRGELWVGAAPGLAEWSAALDLEVRDLEELRRAVARLDGPLLAGHPDRPEGVSGLPRSAELERTLAELRMVKDPFEIDQLRSAVDATIQGFVETVGQIPTATQRGGERWLQGTFDRAARTYGNRPGYSTIVGAGSHAATLHWERADGPLVPGELVLMDMGVEVDSYYTADVTRTFPVAGTFSPVQREVHDLVEKAHRASLAAVGPGRSFSDFFTASMEVIAQGLADWGILPVSVDEALAPDGQQHRRWLVCGIGHHLGLDVHDCARASYDAYQGATLVPGMVMTVEPGLYFHAHDLAVPPELRGIGVRIEDDVLVTDEGIDVLSDALPLSASGLEAWMARQGGLSREDGAG